MDKAIETQRANIEKKSGKTLDDLRKSIQESGLTKHGEQRSFLMERFGLGHGDANTVVHLVNRSDAASQAAGKSDGEVLDEIYSGGKSGLRSIHEALMEKIHGLGDFEIAPKKGYLSLRRSKQFAMVGPGSNTRVDVGLNMRGVEGTPRLQPEKPGGMCQYKVRIESVEQVDSELLGWIKTAYDSAG